MPFLQGKIHQGVVLNGATREQIQPQDSPDKDQFYHDKSCQKLILKYFPSRSCPLQPLTRVQEQTYRFKLHSWDTIPNPELHSLADQPELGMSIKVNKQEQRALRKRKRSILPISHPGLNMSWDTLIFKLERQSFFFYVFIYFNWRIITLQCCDDFCHTST